MTNKDKIAGCSTCKLVEEYDETYNPVYSKALCSVTQKYHSWDYSCQKWKLNI